MFEDSFDELNEILEDCCDKQKMGIIKTEAARLLEQTGDYFHESILHAVNRAVQSLKIKLGYINPPSNSEEKVLDIETSFTLMSIYSYDF